MAEQDDLQRIATDSKYCHELYEQAIAKGPPPKLHRTYEYEIQNMKNDKTWYTLANPNFCPHLSEFSEHYNIPLHCLKYWRKHLVENINWVPDQGHAESQRVFTPEQEKEIANTILHHADNGVPICNDLARHIMLNINQQNININETEDTATSQQKQFAASVKYLRKFRKRHRLSRLHGHLKKRPTADFVAIEHFRQTLRDLMQNPSISGSHILNCDETFWHQTEQSKYTWGRTGQDNVHIYTDGNDKAGTTVLATIDSTGEKFPLVMIGKGTTTRCEKSQFGFSNPIGQENPNPHSDSIHYTEHSKSGWMNEEIWIKYLNNLREQLPYDLQYPENSIQNKIYLTCDSFPTHHDETSKSEAEKLNIEMIPIPKGCTDECQPLDRRIFGSVKQQGRAHAYKEVAKDIVESMNSNTPVAIRHQTKQESCGLLINLWEKLSKTQIQKAWTLSIYGQEKGENQDV